MPASESDQDELSRQEDGEEEIVDLENCTYCKMEFQENDKGYLCDICLRKIHKQCVDLAPSEVKCMPLLKRRLTLLCKSCQEAAAKSANIYKLLLSMKKEMNSLKEEIKHLKTDLKPSSTPDYNMQATYATAASIPTNILKHKKIQTPNIPNIIIKPKNTQGATATKNEMMDAIKPSQLNIAIQKMQTTKTGGIEIKCNSIQDAQKFKKAAEEKLGDSYQIEETKLKNPQIKITGFDKNMTNIEVEQAVKKQNSFISENELFEVVHIKTNSKSNKRTIFIDCSPTNFQRLISVGKVFIDWERYSLYENVKPPQCYQCWGFYHKNTNCTSKVVCSHCAKEHPRRECPYVKTKQNLMCHNCKSANDKYKTTYSTDHEASSIDCPTYQYHTKIISSRINYGQAYGYNDQ